MQNDWLAKQAAPGTAPPSSGGSAKGQTGGLFGGWFGGSEGSGGSGKTYHAPSYPNALKHPKPNDDGKSVMINEPETPSAPETWTDPGAIALFVPGGAVPAELNGVPFIPWTDHPVTLDGWDYVDGQMDDLDEPAMKLVNGKEAAAGAVIEEADGRVWVVRPSNGFAGYDCTFPKGHAEMELSLQAAAIKEAWEESGIKIQITGFIKDVERGQTISRYYTAKRVGGTPADCGWESQGVALVPKGQLIDELKSPIDHPVAYLIGAPKIADEADAWKQVGKQAGSNPGGLFKAPDGVAWYVKFYGGTSRARNELLASKLYAAAGVLTPEVKLITRNGKVGLASKIIPDLKSASAKVLAAAPGTASGFAADAWLCNRDSVGLVYDNLLLDAAGNAVRVDTGGALIYRAQGAPKGDSFGDEATDIDSLRSGVNPQANAVFGGLGDADIAVGVKRVADVSDATIRALTDRYGPGSAKQRVALANRIVARKNYLIKRFL